MNEDLRANRLSDDIDRLMAGEPNAADDPLLDIAKALAQDPVQPSAAASARFEERLNEWFGSTGGVPSQPKPANMPNGVVLVVVLVLLVIGVIVVSTQNSQIPEPSATTTNTPTDAPTDSSTGTPTHTPTHTPTGTPTNTATSTPTNTSAPATSSAIPAVIPSATATITSTATHTASSTVSATAAITATGIPTSITNTPTATNIPYTRIILSGRVEGVIENTITIYGMTIRVVGSMTGLCAGAVVRIEVQIDADGTLFSDLSRITIEDSPCAVNGASPNSGSSGGGSSSGGGQSDGDDDDDD
jgi:hypothetical protein